LIVFDVVRTVLKNAWIKGIIVLDPGLVLAVSKHTGSGTPLQVGVGACLGDSLLVVRPDQLSGIARVVVLKGTGDSHAQDVR